MDAATRRQLSVLLRHYLALSPSSPTFIPSPPFPSADQLAQDEVQEFIASHLATQEDEHETGGAWRKVFWKRLLKLSEDNNEVAIDERILLTSIRRLSAAPEETVDRVYAYGPIDEEPGRWSRFKLSETRSMIVAGTTGLRSWPSGIKLANHMLAQSPLDGKACVLELGSGPGIVALAVASRGTKVVATDKDKDVLRSLKNNVTANGLATQVDVLELDWHLSADRPALEAWYESFREQHGHPTLLLGADITYDPTLGPPLADTLAFLLRQSTAEALIASTIRQETTWTGFLDRCTQNGLSVNAVELQDLGADKIVGGEGYEGEGEVALVRISAG